MENEQVPQTIEPAFTPAFLSHLAELAQEHYTEQTSPSWASMVFSAFVEAAARNSFGQSHLYIAPVGLTARAVGS
ncbi:MAG: hypothetical protein AAGF95_26885 [Chloroflexota bacterium]